MSEHKKNIAEYLVVMVVKRLQKRFIMACILCNIAVRKVLALLQQMGKTLSVMRDGVW